MDQPTIYGYARVSTDGQSLATQIEQLQLAGCAKIFQEKIGGASADRLQLKRLLAAVKAGDTVLVSRLDRLARSTRDLLVMLDQLTTKGVAFRSLHDTWADTASPHGRLLITVIGAMAEWERSLIVSRTSEGRRRAREMGVRFGRKPKLDRWQTREALARRANGESLASIARSYRVSHSTISRLTLATQGP